MGQHDCVDEIIDGSKPNSSYCDRNIIFIHGVCGTGKSGIALNIARSLGKTSIIVPGKNLQEQYKEDLLKKNIFLKKINKKKN